MHIQRNSNSLLFIDRLFWVRQDKKAQKPVQVQMNYKAAHLIASFGKNLW
ncbi:hypothetical protein [Caproicibacterium amylolyticum]|uniref:Uncharacterized protein n=1 Tax=Caproicibacterium amylolyticum TaxID=2766537 RepID=A0A7G9WIG3_9FIRM|nr:hypothetical protein [Caproicibacterium amylolyticum]QNO18475.1 hypothetical protein H6X83_02135 [Caproicibacterium amylolyticum]